MAPKAPAERAIAPMLRGSVTPSSATISEAPRASVRSPKTLYLKGGTLRAMPWCGAAAGNLSSSMRATFVIGTFRACARRMASLTRASTSIPSATRSAVAGTPSRNASTTALRPTTTSGTSLARCAATERRTGALLVDFEVVFFAGFL